MSQTHCRQMQCRKIHRHQIVGLTVALVGLFATPAFAGQVSAPVCTVGGSVSVFPSATATITVDFANSSASTPGFAPGIDLFVPKTGSTRLLTPQTAVIVGETVGIQLVQVGSTVATSSTNPISGNAVTIPANTDYYYLQLPLGSITNSEGPIPVVINYLVNADAPLDVAESVTGDCVFAFGDTPYSTGSTVTTVATPSQTVTPVVVTAVKSTSAPLTVTGPDFAAQFTINITVAPGTTATNLTVTDTIDPCLQPTAVSAMLVDGVGTTPVNSSSFSPTTPGGLVSVEFPSLTSGGGGTHPDAQIVISYYVPQFCLNGTAVISPTAASPPRAISNQAALSSFSYTSLGGPGTQTATTSNTVTISANAFLLTQKITNLSSGGTNYVPGETAAIAISLEASDYFNFSNSSLVSTIGNKPPQSTYGGLAFDNTFTPTLVVNGTTLPTPSFTATRASDNAPLVVSFSPVATLSGPVGNGTNTAVLTYHTTVSEYYDPTAQTTKVLGGQNIDVSTVLGIINGNGGATATDTADSSVPIATTGLTKTIFAVNGLTPVSPLELKPGDTVTWRLEQTTLSSAQSALTITDFLPLPVFSATSVVPSPTPATFADIPVCNATPGSQPVCKKSVITGSPSPVLPGVTADLPDSTTLTFTTLAVDNSLKFSFGPYDVGPDNRVGVDLYFTTTVLDQPADDNLDLTNLAESGVNGSTSTTVAAIAVLAGEPNLVITQGIIGYDSTSAATATNFSPSLPSFVEASPITIATNPVYPFTGTESTATLTATPIASALSNIDAGDTLTYAIIVDNTGHSGAYNVQIEDALPAGLALVGNVKVYDGTGTDLTSQVTSPNSLFTAGTGLTIASQAAGAPAIPKYKTASGTLDASGAGANLLVIVFQVQVQTSVSASTSLTATAKLDKYTNTLADSTSNFVGTPSPYTAAIIAKTRDMQIAKTSQWPRIATNNGAAGDGKATIRDEGTYTVTLSVPEGTTLGAVVNDTLTIQYGFSWYAHGELDVRWGHLFGLRHRTDDDRWRYHRRPNFHLEYWHTHQHRQHHRHRNHRAQLPGGVTQRRRTRFGAQ